MNLPTEMPVWYSIDPEKPDKGWTPKTTDIIDIPKNREITQAWDGTYYPAMARNYTIQIDKLKVISPIQVGGGSFPEGGILPAQVGGVPCIFGSSIRGAFLSFLRTRWESFSEGEKEFFGTLIDEDRRSWLPRKIRFETIRLKDLKPFPLNAQQGWQIFDIKSKQIGVQWQVSPKHPPSPSADLFSLQITLRDEPTGEQKKWLKDSVIEMLRERGIGRGTRSGFGRLATTTPIGTWEIELTGMKPCIQQKDDKKGWQGKYRWNPQVLRANLRGYFTRLALAVLSEDNAKRLTEIIFGGFGSIARLTLTSYLASVGPPLPGSESHGYANILARVAHEIWRIRVNCTPEFRELVGRLLELASRLGGLGPGWRRPPHRLERFGGFRGSQFTVDTVYKEESLEELLGNLRRSIETLAGEANLPIIMENYEVKGTILSVWEGEKEQWEDLVHDVCSTGNSQRPSWCGNSQSRPSGYAVREHSDYCYVTVFDRQVEATLEEQEFDRVWDCDG